jgi:AcrR family transcriptional regulator
MRKAASALQLAKREQILQGALRVFLRSGFAGTSMDRVAAEAGVSKQTIYSHFQDKEGLFNALIQRVTIDRFSDLSVPEQLDRDPETLLRQLAITYFTKIADDPDYVPLLRIVISESERFPELAKLYVRTVVKQARAWLIQYLDHHGELQLADPEAVAHIFIGSMVSLVIVQEVLQGEEFVSLSRDRLVDSLINLILVKKQ